MPNAILQLLDVSRMLGRVISMLLMRAQHHMCQRSVRCLASSKFRAFVSLCVALQTGLLMYFRNFSGGRDELELL